MSAYEYDEVIYRIACRVILVTLCGLGKIKTIDCQYTKCTHFLCKEVHLQIIIWPLRVNRGRGRAMVFNATFNNIPGISWQSVLLVEEITESGENHWQTLSHNVVSSTPCLSKIRTQNVSGDRHWLHRQL